MTGCEGEAFCIPLGAIQTQDLKEEGNNLRVLLRYEELMCAPTCWVTETLIQTSELERDDVQNETKANLDDPF